MKRQHWTQEEDDLLRDLRVVFGRRWSKIALHVPGRKPNQIEDRWTCHLSPSSKFSTL
ncbi:11058_t:CDS:2 [Paraglomus brasilianum]|uniref:11058_t:CDS:1 n=1 Tax=Paraglomus brasilianum TaxID=144538 RepID=A0A9N8ZH75_9GLOM|nr:11058_t:CDS:2 [Paraglomus brasilianum]